MGQTHSYNQWHANRHSVHSCKCINSNYSTLFIFILVESKYFCFSTTQTEKAVNSGSCSLLQRADVAFSHRCCKDSVSARRPQGHWKDLAHATVLTHHTLDGSLAEISFLLHS